MQTEDGILIVQDSTEHPNFPHSDQHPRGKATVMLNYERLAPLGNIPQTRVTLQLLATDKRVRYPNYKSTPPIRPPALTH